MCYGQQVIGYRQREGQEVARLEALRQEAPVKNEPGYCQVCGKPIEDNGTPFCPLCDAMTLLGWLPRWRCRDLDLGLLPSGFSPRFYGKPRRHLSVLVN